MSLVSVAQVRALINTSLSNPNLQEVIDRIEEQITERIGAPQTDAYATTLTKTMRGEGANLFMPTEIYSVTSVVEDTVTLDATEYQTYGGGVIERLPLDTNWGDRITVTYKPADDRKKRTQVIIDLVRLTLERTAMRQEAVGGEYSYIAPANWDAEFRKGMKRLTFQAL